MLPSLLPLAEVRRLVGIGKSQLYRLISDGDFPPPVKIRRSSRWLSSEVHAWIHDQANHRTVSLTESHIGEGQQEHSRATDSREEVRK